jgi:fatty-acyl-CoA synthase
MLDNLTILHEGLPNKHSRRILVVVTMLCRLNKTGCIKNEGIMLAGLMQAAPLLISGILRHAAVAHGDREIVSRLVDEPLWRYDWSRCADRTGRLAQALERLGIVPGDRVTTLAWNTHRHMELMYAAPGMGAVLHTANPRLSDEQIVYTINHAGGRVLFFDRSFVALVGRIAHRLASIEHFVMLSDAERLMPGAVDAVSCEELIAAEQGGYAWPSFDETTGAILCFTSGTTGDPKGVLYSHRSIALHALAAGLRGSLDISAFDVIMPCSSLYHATAWGLPFAAAVNGAKFVLPCDKFDGASLHELIASEGVTMSCGVPTIWSMYLAHLDAIGTDAGTLQRIVIGGSAMPRAMAETFKQRGVTVVQALGMTETSPLIVVATPTPKLMAARGEVAEDHVMTHQGRLIYGVEVKIVDEEWQELPWDGKSAGSLLVRGPWVVDRYYPNIPAVDADGWFDTGDIATMDEFGFMRITDRKKDIIKSGGEWVSSIDLENVAIGCPGVRVAAVIGVYHPRWEERPIMVIEPHDGIEVTAEQVRAFIEPHVTPWWLPDAVVIASVPLTATGKIDKKALRERYRDHLRTAT